VITGGSGPLEGAPNPTPRPSPSPVRGDKSDSTRGGPTRHEPPRGEEAVWVGVRYWLELLRSDPRSPGLPVPADRRFRSGDRVRLHFESNVSGYLSIFQLGSSGNASLLFPAPSSGRVGQRVLAHESTTIPDNGAWFRFDNQRGTERLLVVFAARAEQIDRLGLAAQIDSQRAAFLIAQAALKTGRKDLVLETERDMGPEFGTFVVNLAGEAIVLPLELVHD